MFRRLYEKFIGCKFFNKVLIVYSVIIISMMALLVYIVSTNISSIQKAQSINYNRQILLTMDRYFEDQCRDVKNIHQQILQEESVYSMVRSLLKYGGDPGSEDYMDTRRAFERAMAGKLSSYSDIKHIYLYNPGSGDYSSFYYSSDTPGEEGYSSLFMKSAKSRIAEEKSTQRLFISPSVEIPDAAGRKYHYFAMYDYIRDRNDFSRVLGAMIFDYDSESLKEAYSLYKQYQKGYLMVLSGDGGVIFDSSGEYYTRPFPLYNLIKDGQQGTVLFEDGLINVVRNKTFDFISVGVIPYRELYKDINLTRRYIYTVSLLSILIILVITYFSTRMLSRRLKTVIGSIRRIQKGDFGTRMEIRNRDEIGEISESLNHMCEKINEHIEREFVSELKIKDAELKQRKAELNQNEAILRQKVAELYALQSQIDPHFLYNTLEAVRMKALSTGQGEAGKMIQVLAAMFRNSIKEEMVVSVRNELDFCKTYLELYNIRFADRLRVEFDIAEEILEYGIMKHLLHPIIENSVVHGIDLEQEGNIIRVKGYRSEGDIFIIISDNGIGMDEERLEKIKEKLANHGIDTSESVGIVNVNYRIRLLFGEDYGVTLWSRTGQGTQVTLKISAKTIKELKEHVQSFNCR